MRLPWVGVEVCLVVPIVGLMEGFKLGLELGTGEGFIVGVRLVGFTVGRSVAFFDGMSDGTSVGFIEGAILGFLVGEVVVGFGEG